MDVVLPKASYASLTTMVQCAIVPKQNAAHHVQVQKVAVPTKEEGILFDIFTNL